jgi:hypothetical protein
LIVLSPALFPFLIRSVSLLVASQLLEFLLYLPLVIKLLLTHIF